MIDNLEKTQNVPHKLKCILEEKYRFFTLSDSDELFMYNEKIGIYQNHPEPYIKKAIVDVLKENARTGTVFETINLLKMDFPTDRSEVDNNPELLVVENGILNLNTLELTPHTPELLKTYRIPVNYNPEAKCPEFERFILETIDAPYHSLIYQLLGFILKKRYFPKKAFIIVGEKDTGKTTFLNMLVRFAGEENVTHKTIQNICERFGTADLFGKTANICDDNPAGVLKEIGKFKALTGDSPIEGEIKMVQRKINFHNTAKMIFSCNVIPPASDADDAYFGRWIIIPFTHVFNKTNQDTNKTEKISTPEELSGILNYAIKGYRELVGLGYFDYTDEPNEIKKLYYAYCDDSVCRFLIEKTKYSPDVIHSKEEIFSYFVNYCNEKGVIGETHDGFYRKLKSYCRNKIEDVKLGTTVRENALRGLDLC